MRRVYPQGKKDGCKEWPIPGESLFSYRGKPLPYMPFCYQHPQYWHVIDAETKRTGDMLNSRKLFDDSEAAHPIEEAAVYEHGTHFVFPEGMLKTMLPVGADLFVKLAFLAAKRYPKECRATREDIERRICRTVADWRDAAEPESGEASAG